MLNAEQYHKEKNNILVILDLLAMSISFFTAIMLRYTLLLSWLKSRRTIFMYGVYFLCGAVIYFIAFILKPRPRVERQSYREIIITTNIGVRPLYGAQHQDAEPWPAHEDYILFLPLTLDYS